MFSFVFAASIAPGFLLAESAVKTGPLDRCYIEMARPANCLQARDSRLVRGAS
jgi:hypothetical protein